MSLEPDRIIILTIAACALVAGVFLRLMADKLDRRRVEYFVNGYGNKLLEINWAPFGPWSFGEHSRVYKIRYLDKDGCEHQAYAKTSLMSGVFFSEDRIVRHPSHSKSVANPERKD